MSFEYKLPRLQYCVKAFSHPSFVYILVGKWETGAAMSYKTYPTTHRHTRQNQSLYNSIYNSIYQPIPSLADKLSSVFLKDFQSSLLDVGLMPQMTPDGGSKYDGTCLCSEFIIMLYSFFQDLQYLAEIQIRNHYEDMLQPNSSVSLHTLAFSHSSPFLMRLQ